MTSTAKVSLVEPEKARYENDRPKSQTVETHPKSSYVKAKKDTWKTMTTPSDIGELVDAWNGIERQSQYRGPIHALSSRMVINDPVANRKFLSSFEIPHVPDLDGELFKDNPRLADNMKPIVERYKALLKTFDKRLENALAALKGPMTPLEIQRIQREIEALKYGKLEAVRQLDQANYYYSLQRQRETAAREAAREAEEE